MTQARIYQPAKTAMQSGRANVRKWILEFEHTTARRADPLMGWIGSQDTRAQVRLSFDSREKAVAFAEKHGLEFRLTEPKSRRIRPKNYADNFSFKAIG